MNYSQIKVSVTEADIARAKRNDSYLCVVAQAVARTVPDATKIDVDTQTVRFTSGGRRFQYLTPYGVQGYVIAFDAGDKIEPFAFQLRNPRITNPKRKTDAGKAIERERNRRQRRAPSRAEGADETPRETVARAKAEQAEAEGGDPRAAYRAIAETPEVERDDRTTRTAPRVYKRKQRSYGHRLLRVNQ